MHEWQQREEKLKIMMKTFTVPAIKGMAEYAVEPSCPFQMLRQGTTTTVDEIDATKTKASHIPL